MPEYPFEYDLNVYIAADDHFETAYYTHQKKAYKRTRRCGQETWEQTTPTEIGRDEFWMVVGCISLARDR